MSTLAEMKFAVLRERLARIARIVDDFDKQTSDDEYTDVGDAWDTLSLIRDIAKGKA